MVETDGGGWASWLVAAFHDSGFGLDLAFACGIFLFRLGFVLMFCVDVLCWCFVLMFCVDVLETYTESLVDCHWVVRIGCEKSQRCERTKQLCVQRYPHILSMSIHTHTHTHTCMHNYKHINNTCMSRGVCE